MDATQNGGYKLRSRMVLINEDGQAEAICPSCKHRVEVPLLLGSVSPLPKPTRLIVNG